MGTQTDARFRFLCSIQATFSVTFALFNPHTPAGCILYLPSITNSLYLLLLTVMTKNVTGNALYSPILILKLY